MIVMKFGGTSVGDAQQIQKVSSLVRDRLECRPLVVLSAHAGVTDALIQAAHEAPAGGDNLKALRVRHETLCADLGLDPGRVYGSLFDELSDLLRGIALIKEVTPRTLDYCLSFGERLSTRTVASYFESVGILSHAVPSYRLGFVTDNAFGQASPLPGIGEEIARRVSELKGVGVTTGFIARNRKGEFTTLGRGGSDFTAALFGEYLDAKEIQIWTDVDGVMTADPKIVSGARPIAELSFEEASELAYYGAKVLHPSTIIPAVRKNIPVRVLNTREPDHLGTVIVAEGHPGPRVAKSIVHKRGLHLLNIVSTRMLLAHGFLARIFEVFDRHQVVIDMVATSEVSVSVTTDSDEFLSAAIEDLSAFAEVEWEKEKTVVCVVGHGLRSTVGMASQIFRTMEEEKINIEMISQGATRINVGFLVDDDRAVQAVRALHSTFFEDE
ncbi:MAG: aspartate kinase [Planctomycetota bacterium]|jgi:aspartate kinase|nr:aspartate kinase [Planctomycetota bacterium]